MTLEERIRNIFDEAVYRFSHQGEDATARDYATEEVMKVIRGLPKKKLRHFLERDEVGWHLPAKEMETEVIPIKDLDQALTDTQGESK